MTNSTIQDWTASQVLLNLGQQHDVEYRVYREDSTNYLEMRTATGDPIHTLELPDGMKLEKSSYEVLLRYVLLDVVAA